MSKDWHSKNSPPYNGVWLNAFTQVRLPPKSRQEFELTLAYGFWGGVAPCRTPNCVSSAGAATSSGTKAPWAPGANPSVPGAAAGTGFHAGHPAHDGDRHQQRARHVGAGRTMWAARTIAASSRPMATACFPRAMRTEYRRTGPCLSEVIYTGETGEGLKQMLSASLVRSNDCVAGIVHHQGLCDQADALLALRGLSGRIGYLLQFGTRRVACGDANGMAEEWTPQRGGNVNRKMIGPCNGKNHWISLHDTEKPDKAGANANRGVIIRSWNASIGGRRVQPYLCERGAMPREHPKDGATLADVLLPPDVKQLSPGDRIDAQIELVVVPQFARDYYGPDAELKAALEKDENTARMILREAAACAPDVTVTKGKLLQCFPDVLVQCSEGAAELTVKSGPGFTAVTFAGLKSACGGRLLIDGKEYLCRFPRQRFLADRF